MCYNYQTVDQETYESVPRWEVVCNNGQKYVHHYLEPNSWQLFRNFCQENNLKIINMLVAFRGNIIHILSEKDGYFFRRMERAQLAPGAITYEFFVVGYVENEKLYINKYKVPEMLLDESEVRELTEDNLQSVI